MSKNRTLAGDKLQIYLGSPTFSEFRLKTPHRADLDGLLADLFREHARYPRDGSVQTSYWGTSYEYKGPKVYRGDHTVVPHCCSSEQP